MSRRLVSIALLPATALLLVLSGFAGRHADNPVLRGDVGLNDSFSITLADASGAKVTHLEPGMYTLVVHDHSTVHNFHLLGPGIDVTTGVGGVGDTTFTIPLADGTYTVQCDPHALSGMKFTFTVGTPPAPKAAPAAKIGVRVAPGAKVGVTGIARLSAGPAVITIRDASRTDDFHLVGPDVNKATGVRFKGKATWKLTLAAGKYTFRSDGRHRVSGSFTVAAAKTSSTTSDAPPPTTGDTPPTYPGY
jgi:hypothetical protein